MAKMPGFRIFYAHGSRVVAEEIDVTDPSEAINRARVHCSELPQPRYFEIWRGAHLVFSSSDAEPNRLH